MGIADRRPLRLRLEWLVGVLEVSLVVSSSTGVVSSSESTGLTWAVGSPRIIAILSRAEPD